MPLHTPLKLRPSPLTRLSGLLAIKTIRQLLREGRETDPVYHPLTHSSRQGFLPY